MIKTINLSRNLRCGCFVCPGAIRSFKLERLLQKSVLLAAGAGLVLLEFQRASAQSPTEQEIQRYTAVGVPLDQIGQYVDDTEPAPRDAIKWNRFFIHEPKTALDIREQSKTQDRKAQEELARLAITQAEVYVRARQALEAKKDPQQKADEDRAKERARQTIEKPQEAAREAEKTKGAATRRREQIAAAAILSPREFNAEVERHKTRELKVKEAEAIRAFSQPKEFLAERFWLKKTGSPFPPKGPSESGDDKKQGGDSKRSDRGKGPANEKGGAQ